MENGLDKCSSLPSSDMKIGSHSGLLSKLINILSAKAGLVREQEEPPTPELAGSLGPGLRAAPVATTQRGPLGWQESGWPRAAHLCQADRDISFPPQGAPEQECLWVVGKGRGNLLSVATCARPWTLMRGLVTNKPCPSSLCDIRPASRTPQAWLTTWALQSPFTFPFMS